MKVLFDGVLLFFVVMALVGYNEADNPWMPEHDSYQTIETMYWEGK